MPCTQSATGASKVIDQSVCAIIITYHPDATVVENIAAVRAQVNGLVVVDNGSNSDELKSLRKAAQALDFHLIENRENLGIAKALNIGVRWALDHEYPWVVLFDQDSRVSEQFIVHMLETWQSTARPDKIAIIVPTYVDRRSGVRGRLMKSSNGMVLTAMTSGNLIPQGIFQKQGYFDESLYMDYVDIEFCLRVRQNGMLILPSSAELFHSLGQTTYHRILGLKFGVTNHSVGRRYYMTRNRLRLLARYGKDLQWVWRESLATLSDLVKITLAEKDKLGKFRAMAKGALDALRARTGKQLEL